MDGRQRGYSGALTGDHAPRGNIYALKVSSSNAGIYINGGARGFLVTVDPYGNCPYHNDQPIEDYGDEAQRRAMCEVGAAALRHSVNWHHLKMTSQEFIEVAYVQNLHPWYAGEQREYVFDTVFLDGRHDWPAVHAELSGIRLRPRGIMFIDNVNHEQCDGRIVDDQHPDGFAEELIKAAHNLGFNIELRRFGSDLVARLSLT